MTARQARIGMYEKLAPRDAVAHALTAYDRKMANRAGHNPHFIGIALIALNNAHTENPNADLPELVGIYSGRLLGHLIRELSMTDEYEVGRWGDLERIEAAA